MATRNRYNNPTAQANRVMHALELSKGEVLVASWVLGTVDGLNKDEARKVSAIIDELGLEGLGEVDQNDVNETGTYELSGYEVRFLGDRLDQLFDERKVRVVQAKYAVSLADKLKDALDAKEEPQE